MISWRHAPRMSEHRSQRAVFLPGLVKIGLALAVISWLASCAQSPDLEPLETDMFKRLARVEPVMAGTDFGQSVSAALQRSPTLSRAEAELKAAQIKAQAERGAFLPQLSFSLSAPLTEGSNRSTVGLSQLVYDGGESTAIRTSAEAQMLARAANRVEIGSQAALSSVEAWANLRTARRLHQVELSLLNKLIETAKQIEERSAAGAGSSADSLSAQARIENVRASVEAAWAEVARAEAVFKEVFGKSAPRSLKLPPRAPTLPNAELWTSPRMHQARAELLAQQAELAAAKAGRAPSIAITASANPAGDIVSDVASDYLLAPAKRRVERLRTAEAGVALKTAEIEITKREMQRQISVLQAELDAIDRRYAAARRAATANRENVEAAREQFGIGRRSLLELLDIEREALSSEQLLIRSEFDRAILGYAMLATTGDILDVFGVILPDPNVNLTPRNNIEAISTKEIQASDDG